MVTTYGPSQIPPVNFVQKYGVNLAHEDGLIMVLVPRSADLEQALDVLSKEMTDHTFDEPGISGELILDPDFDTFDLAQWAHDRDLANRRISFHLADELPLEQVAQERFNLYLNTLQWARSLRDGSYGSARWRGENGD
jgi:hypothetical protein